MAGKYSAVLEGKEKFYGGDAGSQEKVQAVKNEIITASAKRLEVEGQTLQALPAFEEAAQRFLLVAKLLQALVDETLDEPLTSARLHALYIAARKLDDSSERLFSQTSRILEAFEQMLVDQFEADDISNQKNRDGDAVRVEMTPHLVVNDKEKFRQWCVANGLESQLHLHWGTANALLKERLLAGMTEMDGCETRNKPKIVYTPSKKEK